MMCILSIELLIGVYIVNSIISNKRYFNILIQSNNKLYNKKNNVYIIVSNYITINYIQPQV